MTPRVVDLYHGDRITDLQAVKDSGIWGVIHKATEGLSTTDKKYATRRAWAKESGLLWGAYHFGSNDDVGQQVDYFLRVAQPDDKTLVCLDFEDQDQMSIDQALLFLELIYRRLGRKAVIYSGNRLKEHWNELASLPNKSFLCSHRLWLCQYGPVAQVPPGFVKPWLWQYTDGEINQPQDIPGIVNRPDLSAYDGTQEQLTSEWAS